MPPESAEELARAKRAYLIAAAGCGKTETAAWAAGIHSDGRQLVLTHTHAGVTALKERLRKIGAAGARTHVDTIAGFALRYAAGFPTLSGLATTEPKSTEDWAHVYAAASRVCNARVGRSVLGESYTGMFVDEYQDCVLDQHGLIMTMAETLPCRVLLDPLQGIFGFGEQQLISHETHLEPTFTRLPDLTTPWRWQNAKPALGEWLVAARQNLQAGRAIDLNEAPVEWVKSTPASQITTCQRRIGDGGSVVAIGQWPPDCHSIASKLKGAYTCMEPLECPDLIQWAARLDDASGVDRAGVLIGFADVCMTRVSTALRSAAESIRGGAIPQVRGSPEVRAATQALVDVARDPTLDSIPAALTAIDQIPGRVLYRKELWREMARTVRTYAAEQHPTLPGAAWHVRDRGRHAGRRVEHRTVSRTLLVKGLEFDHAIVLNGDAHNASNLYVAITRGAKSLTILSREATVTPS